MDAIVSIPRARVCRRRTMGKKKEKKRKKEVDHI